MQTTFDFVFNKKTCNKNPEILYFLQQQQNLLSSHVPSLQKVCLSAIKKWGADAVIQTYILANNVGLSGDLTREIEQMYSDFMKV